MATRRIGQVDRVVATDGELVMRVRNGDQAALAAIYDRYVARLVDLARAIVGPSGAEDVVHDAFVGAAGRIDQLRDPDKLKPWLYRITRRYALAHLRGRRVEPMGLEVNVGDATVDGPLTEAERDELRRLVDDAAAGLEERDRVMLHLLYRHELSPEEAGEVLDMRAEQVHARSFRVRDRFARSLGAVVVARHGRGRCEDLRELLVGWDGTITPRWRKKISRHLDRCEVCSSTKDRVAAPMALLSVAPLVPIAATMRNQTLDAMSNALGFGSFDGGDLDLDGDSSSEQSQQGPQNPSHSSANHPASQGTASSTSGSTASGTAGAGSAAPSASATASSSAGLSSGSSSSVAAGTANAGAAGAAPASSVSASSLTPTGPTTGWPSGTLAAGGSSSGASSSAAAASSAKATSGAAVPPTPEIVSSAPPPPELSEPGIASSLIDTVKAAVGVGVGGAIAVTSTTTPPSDEVAAEDPPGLVIEVNGETIALSPAEPVEVTVPIGAPTTVPAPVPTAPPEPEPTTTTTVPETTTTTTTTVPETTVPASTVPTTTETTVPDPTTTTTTEPEPEPTTTTVPDTTTTVDPLGGPTGADDGETGGSEDEGDGDTGGADDGSTGGADDGSTGGADDGSTGGADEGDTTAQP
ncbi:MAG: sigma-70 family RNA polymerase sigma factor [Actinomycetota bacterium]